MAGNGRERQGAPYRGSEGRRWQPGLHAGNSALLSFLDLLDCKIDAVLLFDPRAFQALLYFLRSSERGQGKESSVGENFNHQSPFPEKSDRDQSKGLQLGWKALVVTIQFQPYNKGL